MGVFSYVNAKLLNWSASIGPEKVIAAASHDILSRPLTEEQRRMLRKLEQQLPPLAPEEKLRRRNAIDPPECRAAREIRAGADRKAAEEAAWQRELASRWSAIDAVIDAVFAQSDRWFRAARRVGNRLSAKPDPTDIAARFRSGDSSKIDEFNERVRSRNDGPPRSRFSGR